MVLRQFTASMQFLVPRNYIEAQGVGFAGEARLAHQIFFYLDLFDVIASVVYRGLFCAA